MIIAQDPPIALLLWILGAILWLGFIYVFFTLMMTKEVKPTLADGVNAGCWW